MVMVSGKSRESDYAGPGEEVLWGQSQCGREDGQDKLKGGETLAGTEARRLLRAIGHTPGSTTVLNHLLKTNKQTVFSSTHPSWQLVSKRPLQGNETWSWDGWFLHWVLHLSARIRLEDIKEPGLRKLGFIFIGASHKTLVLLPSASLWCLQRIKNKYHLIM